MSFHKMPFSSVLRSSDLHLSTSGICDSTVPGANGRLYYSAGVSGGLGIGIY